MLSASRRKPHASGVCSPCSIIQSVEQSVDAPFQDLRLFQQQPVVFVLAEERQ
jgi:hypothetical protein